MISPEPSRKLLIATGNPGKLREFARLLAGLPYRVAGLEDAGVSTEVEETGATFRENALLKASAYARLTGELTLADDSGLEVDALGGEPGVRSARYAGPQRDDEANSRLLLDNLAAVENGERSARYRVVLALVDPGPEAMPPVTAEGVCEGAIARIPAGENGFGYDPLFLVPGLPGASGLRGSGRTMAQLSPEEKDAISHRGMAAREMREILRGMSLRRDT